MLPSFKDVRTEPVPKALPPSNKLLRQNFIVCSRGLFLTWSWSHVGSTEPSLQYRSTVGIVLQCACACISIIRTRKHTGCNGVFYECPVSFQLAKGGTEELNIVNRQAVGCLAPLEHGAIHCAPSCASLRSHRSQRVVHPGRPTVHEWAAHACRKPASLNIKILICSFSYFLGCRYVIVAFFGIANYSTDFFE